MRLNGKGTVIQWLILGVLTIAVVGSSAFINRDVYSKGEVDFRLLSIDAKLIRIEGTLDLILQQMMGDHAQVEQTQPDTTSYASP